MNDNFSLLQLEKQWTCTLKRVYLKLRCSQRGKKGNKKWTKEREREWEGEKDTDREIVKKRKYIYKRKSRCIPNADWFWPLIKHHITEYTDSE